MLGLPDFAELTVQAQQFMQLVQSQIAELKALRGEIDRLAREQAQLRGEMQSLRGQMQRVEATCQSLSSLNSRAA